MQRVRRWVEGRSSRDQRERGESNRSKYLPFQGRWERFERQWKITISSAVKIDAWCYTIDVVVDLYYRLNFDQVRIHWLSSKKSQGIHPIVFWWVQFNAGSHDAIHWPFLRYLIQLYLLYMYISRTPRQFMSTKTKKRNPYVQFTIKFRKENENYNCNEIYSIHMLFAAEKNKKQR